MRVTLGLDTATPATALALVLADGTTLEERDDPTPGEHPGHSTRLLPLAAGLLDRAGLDWGELELIASGIGPGTFTGLRIGLASARGLAHSLQIPTSGVSSLAVLAWPATQTGQKRVLATLDARRGEVFVAAYDQTGELARPSALSPEQLVDLVRGSAVGDGWLAVGDGALRYREALLDAGVEIPPADSPLHLLKAGSVCELAMRQDASTTRDLLPEYCRRPDAEIALEGAVT